MTAATDRPSIPRILRLLEAADRAGARERAILGDRRSMTEISDDYPGCIIITNRTRGQMIYRISDNAVVG